MASIGHLAMGAAGARLFDDHRSKKRTWGTFLFLTAVSFLPDADVIAFAFGIPYAHDFGHRGATHSIAFALVVGLVTWAAMANQRLAIGAGVVTLSHALLDALTDGGLGVALWWPLSSARVFLPWRPIPVAPIGHAFVSYRGLVVALTEVLLFAPAFLYAVWPRSRSASRMASRVSAP